MGSWRVIQGDVLDVARGAIGDCGPFDALLSDPPYGINFMGNAWDHGVPSAEVWRALAVHLRPGANVAAFGGTRTWHRLAVAMEDSGLEMRDSIMAWMYGSGWAKPANVSRFIDESLGATREVIGRSNAWRPNRDGVHGNACGAQTAGGDITAPATPEAERFEGWHANLSPSWEPALLFRRPLDGTLARNAIEHGVAGLWMDGARTGRLPGDVSGWSKSGSKASDNHALSGPNYDRAPKPDNDLGRWPKNAILCCEEATCGDAGPGDEHAPGCPVARIGPAAVFFYIAKVSRRERNEIPHPCMKPIALCRQIATLLLPPPRADSQPRRILVPYSGSGSEMIGCLQAGWDEVVGIEMELEWVSASRVRIADFTGFRAPHDDAPAKDAPTPRPGQLGLFS